MGEATSKKSLENLAPVGFLNYMRTIDQFRRTQNRTGIVNDFQQSGLSLSVLGSLHFSLGFCTENCSVKKPFSNKIDNLFVFRLDQIYPTLVVKTFEFK